MFKRIIILNLSEVAWSVLDSSRSSHVSVYAVHVLKLSFVFIELIFSGFIKYKNDFSFSQFQPLKLNTVLVYEDLR